MADVDDRWYRMVKGPDGKMRKERTARYDKGKRWDARWRDQAGKPRHRAFERKLNAERFLAGLQADLLRGTYIDPAQGKITLRSYAEQRWLPAQVHLRPNSAARYAAAMHGHIVPLLGDRPLGALRRTCSLMPASRAAARWTRCSPRLMCAQCAPGSDHEDAGAGQRQGGGRAGL
jgi:hypothetical protein